MCLIDSTLDQLCIYLNSNIFFLVSENKKCSRNTIIIIITDCEEYILRMPQVKPIINFLTFNLIIHDTWPTQFQMKLWNDFATYQYDDDIFFKFILILCFDIDVGWFRYLFLSDEGRFFLSFYWTCHVLM